MLKTRLLSALWGIPLLVTVIWFGEPWFTIVFCIWGLLANGFNARFTTVFFHISIG